MAHLAERHLAVQQDFPGYINTFYKVLLCVERNIVKSVLLHVKPPFDPLPRMAPAVAADGIVLQRPGAVGDNGRRRLVLGGIEHAGRFLLRIFCLNLHQLPGSIIPPVPKPLLVLLLIVQGRLLVFQGDGAQNHGLPLGNHRDRVLPRRQVQA